MGKAIDLPTFRKWWNELHAVGINAESRIEIAHTLFQMSLVLSEAGFIDNIELSRILNTLSERSSNASNALKRKAGENE